MIYKLSDKVWWEWLRRTRDGSDGFLANSQSEQILADVRRDALRLLPNLVARRAFSRSMAEWCDTHPWMTV